MAAITDINEDDAKRHIQQAHYRAELKCKKLDGFHLQKLYQGGVWKLRFQLPGQPQRNVQLGKYRDGSQDRVEAARKARHYLTYIKNGIDPTSEKQKLSKLNIEKELSVNGFLETDYTEFQNTKTNRGVHTLNMIRRAFSTLLDRPLSTISQSDIEQWHNEYKKEHKHATSLRNFGAFKAMLNYAVNTGALDKNPIGNVHLSQLTESDNNQRLQKQDSSPARKLSKMELLAYKNATEQYRLKVIQSRENSRKHGKTHLPSLTQLMFPHWFFAFLKIAQLTGMRTGDIYSLIWENVDFECGKLTKLPNKTKHHPEPVSIEFSLEGLLGETLKTWNIQQDKPNTGLVFPSPISGKKLSKDAHIKHWVKINNIANLSNPIAFSGWRHHFISKLIKMGVPTMAVAMKVGHKDTRMIERLYKHSSQDVTQNQLQQMGKDF